MENNRNSYIDTMRGLAMFMVVTCHLFSISGLEKNIFNDIVDAQLQLPLFFFLSGFFANKITSEKVGSKLCQRFMQLVIPGAAMLLLYCWICNYDLESSLYSNMKVGYWFTFVLFYFFGIYAVTDIIGNKLLKKVRYLKALHICIGVLVLYFSSAFDKPDAGKAILLFSIPQWWYYIFFVMGSILFPIRVNIMQTPGSSKTNWIWMLILVVAIIGETYMAKYGLSALGKFALLVYCVLVLSVILLVWRYFASIKDVNGNIVGRFLSLVGRRSLDVYLIHYFFLPSNLSVIAPYFGDNPLLSYIFAILLAIPITLASIGIGSLIRLSPITGKLLLGAK